MAKDKNSFILYCDIIKTVEQLPDDMAGKLFKHVLHYVNDNNPETDDLLLNIAFEPIKQSLKRSLIKYENRKKTAQLNGLKGGRPKNPEEPKKPSGLSGLKKEPRKAVSVSVSVPVSVSVKDKKTSCPIKYLDDDYAMSEFIFDRIKAFYPNAKNPNLDRWANTIRLMRHSDNLSHKQIQTVFIWANNNSFWQANIRSPEKLREKYEELDIKMQQENNHGNNTKSYKTNSEQFEEDLTESELYLQSLIN